ncbi:transcription antitermination factor NusB [Anaerolineales bacterium HSG24]|nr:transcription antitermination factor NusB [Anaerolineales bacterium HSG24]
MMPRRRARAVTLQALYELDYVDHAIETTLTSLVEQFPLPEAAEEFAWSLATGIHSQRDYLDDIVKTLATEWPITQLAAVDRNVLRIAVYEFLFKPEIPPKVTINEAVELAKMFGGESSPRFVNGVLGSLLSHEEIKSEKISKYRSGNPSAG